MYVCMYVMLAVDYILPSVDKEMFPYKKCYCLLIIIANVQTWWHLLVLLSFFCEFVKHMQLTCA